MQKKEKEEGGFLKKLSGLLFSGDDPVAAKRKDLKKIAKEINRQKFKWYKPSSGEALPQMGRFFYEIYATIGPAQGILSNANASAALKMVVVEESLSERQRKIKENLTEERLKERAEQENANTLETQVTKELNEFQRGFTPDKAKAIDHIYSQIEEFSNFVMFDYYFMLKKFDSSIPERNYTYVPQCATIRGEYVLDDLKDFAAVAYGLSLNADWKTIFAIIKSYKGAEPAAIARWTKLIRALAEVRKSDILTLIIKHIEQNPAARVKPVISNVRVVDAYISKMRTQTESFLKRIVQETKTSKASQLVLQLFGPEPPEPLSNYTVPMSETFKRRGFTGFARATELNYLCAFFNAYLKTDITEITSLCLVRGQWTLQDDSAAFSNSYHALIDLAAKIKSFDATLSDDAPLGTKLKSLLVRQEHDHEARDQLKTQLKDINRDALSLLTESAQNLVVIGRNIKLLIDDYAKQPHKLISNWKEIESNSQNDIADTLAAGYKKVYAMVMLLQIYLKGGTGKGE